MKKTGLLLLVFAIAMCSIAQDEEKDRFEKLKTLFEAEKYEDCAYKAENFTMKENTRKDAEPYLYLSMCNFKIHQIGGKEEEYPKAYDDAFKYASKFRSKDKDGSVYAQNKDFFNELKAAGVKDATDLYGSNDYKKAASTLKKVNKFCEEDANVLFSKGVFDILSMNLGEGGMAIKESSASLHSQLKSGSYEKDGVTEDILADAFILYTGYLSENSLPDSAKATITLGKNLLKDNAKIDQHYEGLVK